MLRRTAGARLRAHVRRLLRRNARGEQECGAGTAPRISVIIPMHGTEAYLERCLRSVQEQTFSDIEILCVDDASPDNCATIVTTLARRDARLRLIRHPHNRGLGGARNSGIAAARGTYVTGIDSDDLVRPSMMERLWQASGEGVADVVVCGMDVVTPEGQSLHVVSQPAQNIHHIPRETDFINRFNPSFCNKLWRTSLFRDHDIRFPEHQYFEDLATTPRLLRFATDIRVIPDPLYCYVKRDDSITHSSSARHILDHFRTFDTLVDFLEAEALLEVHWPALVEMIGKSLHYHTRTGLGANADPGAPAMATETRQYLRYMLLMKLAYLEYNEKLRSLEADALQALLLKARSASDLPTPPSET